MAMTAQQSLAQQQQRRIEAEITVDTNQVNASLGSLLGKVEPNQLAKAYDSNDFQPRFVIDSKPRSLSAQFKTPVDTNPTITGQGGYGHIIEIDTTKGPGKAIKDEVVKIIQDERKALNSRITEMKQDPVNQINTEGVRISRQSQYDKGMRYEGTAKEGDKSYPFSITKMNLGAKVESYLLEVNGNGEFVTTHMIRDNYTTKNSNQERFNTLKAFFEKMEKQQKLQNQ